MARVPMLNLGAGDNDYQLTERDDSVPKLFGPGRNAAGRRTASLLRRTNIPSDPNAGVTRDTRSETARAYRVSHSLDICCSWW